MARNTNKANAAQQRSKVVTLRFNAEDYARLQAAADRTSQSAGQKAKAMVLNAMEVWDGSLGALRESARAERNSAVARTLTLVALAVESLLSRPDHEPRDERDAASIELLIRLLPELFKANQS